MPKKIIITESQYDELISRLRERNEKDKAIVESIIADIEKYKKNLNEGEILEEGILDVIKKYARKGVLTVAVIASLLSSTDLSAAQLQQAGVEPVKIEQAEKQVSVDDMDMGKLEKKFVQRLKQTAPAAVQRYENLSQEEKTQILNQVKQNINQLSDLKDYTLRLSKSSRELGGTGNIELSRQERIVVDTVVTTLELNIGNEFLQNSSELSSVEQTKAELQEALNSFVTVTNIEIVSSSSALRNTGDYEGKTWMELSGDRASTVEGLLNDIGTYNLGGCDANESKSLDAVNIEKDIAGENGDGTSGPPSPFEVDDEARQAYADSNLDPSLWDSDAEGQPYASVEDFNELGKSVLRAYDQHQFVKVIITGEMVDTDTDKIINVNYITMHKAGDDGKIKINKSGKKAKQGYGVLSCGI
jgi:hypothetical protein